MGPPPWSLRKTDAHDCIMVPDSDESTAYKFAGRNYARARREAPLGIAALRKRRDQSKLWLDINRPIQVPTKSILTAANVPIIGGHHVLALQSSPEGWQATPPLERCREHARRRRAHGATARAVSLRDQRFAGIVVAAVDRGFRGRRRAAADPVAVSGRPCRGAAGGRFDRRRQTVGIAVAAATAVGRVLAGTDAMARAAARPVLVEAVGSEPQRDAVGSGAVRAGRLPSAGAGQRMAPAS